MKTYTTVTKDFAYRGEHYTIVFDGKFYMTVNHKFIGDGGRLTKELGFTDGLHTNKSLEGCIKTVREDLDMKYYISHGMSKAEAFVKIFPEVDIETAKMIYGE